MQPSVGNEVVMVHKSSMSWDDVQCFLSVARSGSARANHEPFDPKSNARWLEWGKASPYPDILTQYTMDQAGTQLAAVRAGMVMLPCFLADNGEGIKRLSNCEPQLNHEIRLLSHPDLREVTRLRKFREFVVELFEQQQAFLAGK